MSARRPVIAGNWKMYKTAGEAARLAEDIRTGASPAPTDREVVVAPPFTALPAVAAALRGSTIGLAGQNLHSEAEGAFTGEVSPAMLKDAGCSHVILGHSERRQLFGETDEGVAQEGAARPWPTACARSSAWARRWRSARPAAPPRSWSGRSSARCGVSTPRQAGGDA